MTMADPSAAVLRPKYALILFAAAPVTIAASARGVGGPTNHMNSGQSEHV